jgi:hypothetical protein
MGKNRKQVVNLSTHIYSKQGERTLIRLVKQDRKRSLRDLMNEFIVSLFKFRFVKGQFKDDLSKMSTYLAQLIFPSTSVIVPTPSLQIHTKTLDTRVPPLRRPYSPKHSVFHFSFAFHHTYTCAFYPS